jgi:hypothetical protein
MAGYCDRTAAMSDFSYGFIFGIFILLLTVYLFVLCNIYSDYRNLGMTRKQAALATWSMKNE